ncbi:hypothetical protein PS467_09165 [Streptomyces luomodiensis]|uniref:Cytidine deaminase n=1 Tax=Streptomyces luomodiensis TaxID=3026192 RepID=A0ABY9UTA1_9ACTN|nr:hypothetical protein [Streptomyces sp. SCA4-21]WNE95501.1 hypothetical protein PS467_09165 [Streptomyces sp. SCA4-21]
MSHNLYMRAQELYTETTDAITRHYRHKRHQIAAGIATASGRKTFGLHIEAMVGRASSCAETAALAQTLILDAEDPVELVVAVRHPAPDEEHMACRIVPPCGLCRELLSDYAPGALVILPNGADFDLRTLTDLLPAKYVGTKWNKLG